PIHFPPDRRWLPSQNSQAAPTASPPRNYPPAPSRGSGYPETNRRLGSSSMRYKSATEKHGILPRKMTTHSPLLALGSSRSGGREKIALLKFVKRSSSHRR